MISRTLPRPMPLLASGLLVLVAAFGTTATSVAATSSDIYLVQGVPGASVDVSIDGEPVRSDLAAQDVVGPLDLTQGSHTVRFRSPQWSAESSFAADQRSMDVVLHWPADATDRPTVTVFTNDVRPVPAGEGRLTVAHTAVVPPADVRASGEVLFSNIANGEFVTAQVPEDTYSVDVVPTGGDDPLLGPLDLKVQKAALTRVFAIGAPENGSMNAVVQVIGVGATSVQAPGSVDAGSAGLVAPDSPGPGGADLGWHGPAAVLAAALFAVGLLGWGKRPSNRR